MNHPTSLIVATLLVVSYMTFTVAELVTMLPTAVCLYSVRFRSLEITGESIAKYLVGPLNADVFIAGDLAVDEVKVLKLRLSVPNLRLDREHLLVERQMSVKEVEAVIPESARRQTELYGTGERNATFKVFEPSTLLGFYWRQKCFELVEAEERRRGRKYGFVVFARPDMEWLYEHPPVKLLSPRKVWVPTLAAFDRGAVQTSTLTCPRELCPHFAYKWELARNGTMRRILANHCADPEMCKKRGGLVNAEKTSAILFETQGVEVGYYMCVSAIVCNNMTCTAESLELCRDLNATVTNCGNGEHWKYSVDAQASLLHSIELKFLGGWTRAGNKALFKEPGGDPFYHSNGQFLNSRDQQRYRIFLN